MSKYAPKLHGLYPYVVEHAVTGRPARTSIIWCENLEAARRHHKHSDGWPVWPVRRATPSDLTRLNGDAS